MQFPLILRVALLFRRKKRRVHSSNEENDGPNSAPHSNINVKCTRVEASKVLPAPPTTSEPAPSESPCAIMRTLIDPPLVASTILPGIVLLLSLSKRLKEKQKVSYKAEVDEMYRTIVAMREKYGSALQMLDVGSAVAKVPLNAPMASKTKKRKIYLADMFPALH